MQTGFRQPEYRGPSLDGMGLIQPSGKSQRELKRMFRGNSAKPDPVLLEFHVPDGIYMKPVVIEKNALMVYDEAIGPHRNDYENMSNKSIVRAIAFEYGLASKDVIGRNRSRKFIPARQRLCYVLNVEKGLSLPKVGKVLDGRDHTTVLHFVRKEQKRLDDLANGLAPETPEYLIRRAARKQARTDRVIKLHKEGKSASEISNDVGLTGTTVRSRIVEWENSNAA